MIKLDRPFRTVDELVAYIIAGKLLDRGLTKFIDLSLNEAEIIVAQLQEAGIEFRMEAVDAPA